MSDARDFGELLWLIAEWEARHPGYSTRLQHAVSEAVPLEDKPALLEAQTYPYLNRPTDDRKAELKAEWARVHSEAVA